MWCDGNFLLEIKNEHGNNFVYFWNRGWNIHQTGNGRYKEMKKMYIGVKRIEDGIVPQYKTDGASGADCFARIHGPIRLFPGERRLIPLGFAVEIPQGLEMQIRPRSGNANNKGLTILNTPGTIDSDYRGEVHANIINLGIEPVEICPEDRIAQAVICPVIKGEWVIVDELSETERGSNGHGSTGI